MLLGAVVELMTIGAVLPFLALLSNASGASRSPAAGWIFGMFGWTPDRSFVLPATIALVLIAVLGAVIRLVLTWVTQKFVFRLGHDIGVIIYSRMLRQPYSFYVLRNSSEILSGVEKVQSVIFALLLPAMQGVVATIIAVFIVGILVAIDPFTALVAAFFMAAVYIAVSVATRKLLQSNSKLIAEMQTQRIKQVQEGLGGIREILLDQSQGVFEDSFRRLDNALRNAQTANVFVGAAPRFVVESAGIVLIALLALYMDGQPGGMVAAIPLLGALALGAQRLLPLLQLAYFGWSQCASTAHLLYDIVALVEAPVVASVPRDRTQPIRPFSRDIALDAVTFGYADGPDAVIDVSLGIVRGERIGFVGPTGSGKSTLLDLVMGLLEPDKGEIRIDGTPLDDATRAEWQAQIAHVPQAIYLSDASIAANIAFGEPAEAIDMTRVREAAARSMIDAFIMDLPQGYDTVVGERGVRLSGGQRQRIGIARALYKRSPFLILDEATSALDDRTEAAVMGGIASLREGVTVLMIAHRTSSLANCDRVIRMEHGRVMEIGTYAQMIGSDTVRTHANG